MIRFLTQRLSEAIVVILIVSVMVFLLVHMMPGDPVLTMLGLDATESQIIRLREELGFNDPLAIQFWHWLTQVLSGDLGQSITYREPVLDILMVRLPVTAILGLCAFGVAVVFGILAGMISAMNRGTWIDGLVTVAATLGLATPIFWLGVVAIYFFSLHLGWLPTQGYVSFMDDPVGALRHMAMPVLALSFAPMAAIARQTRSSVLEVIHQDYVRTAWSKGLSGRKIMLRHVLRNALMPIMTLMGVHLNSLLGGSVIVETVFNLPGMGRLIVNSVFDRDIQVIQSCILVFASIVIVVNLLVDLSYGILDPRTR
tara:strand:+ start:34666 stop:35604 length:939 start_codon:yes stop_codon:yes gene_type:complete